MPPQKTPPRKSGVKKQNRIYHILGEGLTEMQYFEGVTRNLHRLGIRNPNLEIITLPRNGQMADFSKAEQNLERIDQYKRALLRKHDELVDVPIEFYVADCIGQLYTAYYGKYKPIGPDNRKVREELYELQTLIGRNIESDSSLSIRDRIKDPDRALLRVQELITSPKFEELKGVIVNRNIHQGFNPELDKICYLIDRDFHKEERNHQYYEDLLEKCDDKQVSLYVSNPAIEFWLILHYQGEFSPEEVRKLVSNRKEPNLEYYGPHPDHNYAEIKLSELIQRTYRKYDICFDELYLDHVDDAIKNAQKYCTSDKKLERELGSSIYKLIEELRKG